MRNLNTKIMSQLFILLFSLLNSTLAQAKFDLPPLKTDAEKLSFLLQVRQQIPKLFVDAAKYDIDLFTLLDNEAELISLLQRNHVNFDKLYSAKKYLKMTIEPTADIWIGQVEIDPKAMQDWKNSLHQKIKDAKELVKFEDIPGDTQKMLDIDPVKLLNTFGMVDKKDKKSLNKFRDKNKKLLECKKQDNLFKKYKCIFDSYEAFSDLPKLSSKEEIERIMNALREEERILPLLHLAIIKQYKRPQNWQNFTNIVASLNSQDLLFLSDKNDGLKPLLLTFFNDDEFDPRFILTLNRIHKELEVLSEKTISRATKINKGIELMEIPPTVGIFRGCIGGDCSSQYSFPYPNDPHERVFLIKKLKPGLKEGDNDQLKGYVSATEVIVNGEPALYVVTISGVNVSAADTELVFRGLDEAKEKLGVKLIVLPASEKLGELINFPAIHGVYKKHLDTNSTRISIQYKDQDIRKEIQNYQPSSKYNSANYDHMSNNMNGAVLSFNSAKNVATTMTSIKRVQNDVSLLDPDNVFDFIYELKKSKRKKTIKKILRIPEVGKFFGDGSGEKIRNFFKLIRWPKTEQKMKISEFRNYIITELKKLNFSLSDSYVEKFSKLMHYGYIYCEDIFNEKNIEKTAIFLASDMEKNKYFYYSMAREDRLKILNTKKFAELKISFYKALDSGDLNVFSNAVKFFEGAETIDEPTFQKLISIITNFKHFSGHRETAIKAFYKIQANDYAILMNSLVSCVKEGDAVVYTAAEFLLKIGQQDSRFIEAFINCLNDVSEQKLVEIIGNLRGIIVNNPVIFDYFIGRLRCAQENKKYVEMSKILEALIRCHTEKNNEIINNRMKVFITMLSEIFMNHLNDARGPELVEILRVLRMVVEKNRHFASERANHPKFIEAFINCLNDARGPELIELVGVHRMLFANNPHVANDIANSPKYIEPFINYLNDARGPELIGILRELGALVASNVDVANDIATNPKFIEAFINCLNDARGPELIEILRVLRALVANNPDVVNIIANHPKFTEAYINYSKDTRGQELEILRELREHVVFYPLLIEAYINCLNDARGPELVGILSELRMLVASKFDVANEIANHPKFTEAYINCLNDARGPELIGILRVLRALVANNPDVVNIIANHPKFTEAYINYLNDARGQEPEILRELREHIVFYPLLIEAYINCLNDARGPELIEILRELGALVASKFDVANDMANHPKFIEAFFNCLNDAHGHELEIINALENLTASRAYNVDDQIANDPIFIEAVIRYLNNTATHNRIELIEKSRILSLNHPVIIEGLIKCLNVQDDKTRFAVIHQLKKIMAKEPKDIEQVMSYVKRHVYNNVSETAKLLFGDEYKKFFARSADCNLL